MKTASTTTTNVKLSHNQQVAYKGAKSRPVIRIFDALAYDKDLVAISNGLSKSMDYWRAIAIRNSSAAGLPLVASIQDSSILTSDYEGKDKDLALAKSKYESAPVLETGQIVEVNDVSYQVHIINTHANRKRIQFLRTDGLDQYIEATRIHLEGVPPQAVIDASDAIENRYNITVRVKRRQNNETKHNDDNTLR